MLKRFYKSLFLTRRFFAIVSGLILLFVLAFWIPVLFNIGRLLLIFLGVVTLLDYFILFSRKTPVDVSRQLTDRLSNGDVNPVLLSIKSGYTFPVSLRIIDELPEQFQQRNFFLDLQLKAGASASLDYTVQPKERGEYIFHDINVFIRSPFGLTERRKIVGAEKTIRVMPSYQALRQFELIAGTDNLAETGSKRIRKLGHSLEF